MLTLCKFFGIKSLGIVLFQIAILPGISGADETNLWDELLLQRLKFTSQYRVSNDALRAKNQSEITDQRTTQQFYDVSLTYEATPLNFYNSLLQRKEANLPFLFINWKDVSLTLKGGHSNTISEITNNGITPIKSEAKLSWSLGLKFEICFSDLFNKDIIAKEGIVVGCWKKATALEQEVVELKRKLGELTEKVSLIRHPD